MKVFTVEGVVMALAVYGAAGTIIWALDAFGHKAAVILFVVLFFVAAYLFSQ